MIFEFTFSCLILLVWLTVRREYVRARRVTLLSCISIGNLIYMGVTPAIWYWARESAALFETYVYDAGLVVDEIGVTRVLWAAIIFQIVCLFLCPLTRKNVLPSSTITNPAVLKAATIMGIVLIAIGLVGVVLLGVKYNGNTWGLYEIAYIDRSPLARENPIAAFLLLMGIYGAAQLIVVFLLSGRIFLAALILLAVTLHGLGMKSKLPVFWVLIVFVGVAISQRKNILRFMVPLFASVLVLGTMSVLRGVERISDLPEFIATSGDIILLVLAAPWENDIPGPVSITYYIINANGDYTMQPMTDVFSILVPRFLMERGPVVADVWAEKMMGSSWEVGLGLGWSPICDGFLLGGWLGVVVVAMLFVGIGRYIDRLPGNTWYSRELFVLVLYCCTPLFLSGVRESLGGLIKQLLVLTLLVWLPTFYLAQKWKRRIPSVVYLKNETVLEQLVADRGR